MRSITPVKFGELRNSLFSRQTTMYRMEIGSRSRYAIFVEKGTRPHMIYPVRARALRFVVDGKVVFARKVRHPGTRAQPFVKPTVDRFVVFIREQILSKVRIFITGRV